MARTFNRQPMQVGYPSKDNVKDYFFNHYEWKGVNDDKNFLEVDQHTFNDAMNVYMDSESLLRSRPSMKNSNITSIKNIIDFWVFGDIIVYLAGTTSYTLYFTNKTTVFGTDTFNSKDIKLVLVKRKIFVFTPTSLSYFDMDTNSYYTENTTGYVSPVYIPVTKRLTASTIDDVEDSNILTTTEIYTYLYSKATGVNISIYGKTVTFELNGKKYTITFTVETQDVLIDTYYEISNIFQYNFTGTRYDFDIVVSSKNMMALYSRTNRALLITTDGKSFESFVLSDSCGTVLNSSGYKAIKFSQDGSCIIIVTTVGIFVLSVIANTSTGVKTYPVFTNVAALSKYSALNSINFGDFQYSNDYVGVYPEICVDFFEEDIFTIYTSEYSSYGVYDSSTFYFVNGNSQTPVQSITTSDGGTSMRQIHNNAYIRCLYGVNANYVWHMYDNTAVSVNCDSAIIIMNTSGLMYCVRFGDTRTIIEQVSLSPVGTHYNHTFDTLLANGVIYIANRTTTSNGGGNIQLRRMSFLLSDADVGKITQTYFANTVIYADYTRLAYGTGAHGQVYFYRTNNEVVYDFGIFNFAKNTVTSFLTPDVIPDGIDEEDYEKKYILGVYYGENTIVYYLNYAQTTPGSFIDYMIYNTNFDGVIALNYTKPGDNNYIVPDYDCQLHNLYFAVDNIIMISSDRYDSNDNWQFYFPKKQSQKFNYNITGIHPISDDTVAVFCETEINYITYDSSVSAYTYQKSKLQVGLPEGNNVITSLDGTTILFVTKRGLVGLGYQDFIASTEQALSYLSDSIFQWFNDWNTSAIRLHLHGFWLICYKQTTGDVWVYDIRNKSWWPCEYKNHHSTKFLTMGTELLCLADGVVYDFDRSDENYYDDDGEIQQKINWYIVSQKLYLNAANYYKHIINITLGIALDTIATNEQAAPTMNLQVCNYRKIRNVVDTENFSYNVDMIRTFVHRLNYFKVCEFQYKLSSDDENVIQVPLSLANVTVKYKIAGEVR